MLRGISLSITATWAHNDMSFGSLLDLIKGQRYGLFLSEDEDASNARRLIISKPVRFRWVNFIKSQY